jgi:hypothetical protein
LVSDACFALLAVAGMISVCDSSKEILKGNKIYFILINTRE